MGKNSNRSCGSVPCSSVHTLHSFKYIPWTILFLGGENGRGLAVFDFFNFVFTNIWVFNI